MKRTRNITDPDFPHGTDAGYKAGCRAAQKEGCPGKPTCSKAHSTRSARNRMARDGQAPPGPNARVPVIQVRDHVDALLAAHLMTPWRLSLISGVHKTVIRDIANGTAGTVTRDVRDRLRAVTLDDVATSAPRLAGPYRRIVRQFQAAGYPLDWQRRNGGFAAARVVRGGTFVTADTAHRIEALAARLGTRRATPEHTGVALNRIKKAAQQAADLGYKPPEPTDLHRCAVLRSIVIDRRNIGAAADQHAVEVRSVQRWLRDAGVSVTWDAWDEVATATYANPRIGVAVCELIERMRVEELGGLAARRDWTIRDVDPAFDASAEWEALLHAAGRSRRRAARSAA